MRCRVCCCVGSVFFFQAEDGIRDAQESRGLGDVYKRQVVIVTHQMQMGQQALPDHEMTQLIEHRRGSRG